MIAKVQRTAGVMGGGDPNQPVQFTVADCMLYKDGKEHMRIITPQAVWQNGHLTAGQTAHHNQTNGVLHMTDANGQQYKDGKVFYTAQGPRADYQYDLLTMPAGG